MTTYDHVMTMTTVKIAELKARLSEYLHQVRRGREVTVLDRTVPVARIVPVRGDEPLLSVRPPLPRRPRLQSIPLPPPLALKSDVMALLSAERQERR